MRLRRAVLIVALMAAPALLAGRAAAVVGGADDAGPLSRRTVMVLGSQGGVCTGIVVAPDAVLTAAHCATAPESRIHYRDADGQPVLLQPRARVLHPGYDRGAVAARRRSIDLSLMRLDQPLPARFEVAALQGAGPRAGARLVLGGYGVARPGDARSTGTFRTASLPVVEPHGPSRILVWLQGAGSGACTGDSGGPIADEAGIVAVATWATGPGSKGCGALSQGVLVGPQRDWIDRTLGGWGRQAVWR